MSVTPAKKRSEYSASDTVIFTYAYDGSRLSKTVGQTKKNSGTTTEYVLNGSTILAQNTTYPDGSKETMNFYYSSDGKLLEIGYFNNTSNDDTKKEDIKETHYSVIRNAMGDVAALYTADGTLVGTYEYDPYGRLLSETSNPSYTDTNEILHKNPFRYRGYYYDQETKWYYLQSRYYDPQVKRFINADSTELLTTDNINLMQYNLFAYCNDTPICNYDPFGYNTNSISIGVNAILLFGFSGSIDFSWDEEGNIAIQRTISRPSEEDTKCVGAFCIGTDISYQRTSAESVFDLEGISSNIGFSTTSIPSVGISVISFEPLNNMNSNIDGIQLSLGIGGGLDLHMIQSITDELKFQPY